jgi:hypothetical protein
LSPRGVIDAADKLVYEPCRGRRTPHDVG